MSQLLAHALSSTLSFFNNRERTDKTCRDLEKKQDDVADSLTRLQQEYQQTMEKAGVVR